MGIRLNWKIVVGIVLIGAGVAELKHFLDTCNPKETGILDYIGIGIGFVVVLLAGLYFIKRGRKDLGY